MNCTVQYKVRCEKQKEWELGGKGEGGLLSLAFTRIICGLGIMIDSRTREK